MLSKLQVTAFKMHSVAFFYLPGLPYPLKQITADKHQFVVCSLNSKWLSIITLFCLMLIHGGMLGVGAVYWGFVTKSKTLSSATLVCFAVLSFCTCAGALVAFSVFLRVHPIASCLNELIGLDTELSQKLSKISDNFIVIDIVHLTQYLVILQEVEMNLIVTI